LPPRSNNNSNYIYKIIIITSLEVYQSPSPYRRDSAIQHFAIQQFLTSSQQCVAENQREMVMSLRDIAEMYSGLVQRAPR